MKTAESASSPTPRQRHWRSTLFQLIVVGGVAGFGAFSLLARRRPYFSYDVTILRTVQKLDTPWGHTLMKAASYPGYPPQATLLGGILPVALYLKGMKWEAITAAISAAGISVVGLAVKLFVNRPRPLPSMARVHRSLDGGLQSFPAGHVQVYVPLFGFIAFLNFTLIERSWQRTVALITSFAMIVLVGPSRIHAGEHWPSDVLGGYFLGSLWLWLTVQLYRWGKSRYHLEGEDYSHGNGTHSHARAVSR